MRRYSYKLKMIDANQSSSTGTLFGVMLHIYLLNRFQTSFKTGSNKFENHVWRGQIQQRWLYLISSIQITASQQAFLTVRSPSSQY